MSRRGNAARWRRAVMVRGGWRCALEGPDCDGPLEADHVTPLAQGGAAMDPRNGQVLCHHHHATKSARERGARPPRRADPAWDALVDRRRRPP